MYTEPEKFAQTLNNFFWQIAVLAHLGEASSNHRGSILVAFQLRELSNR
jgi:hypothetical protein